MKTQIAFLLISALACLSACSEAAPGSGAQSQQGSGWSFRMRNQCKNVPAEACAGGYGFTVHSDGRYTVGPGPLGETLSAPLPAEDFAALLRGYERAFGKPDHQPESEICGSLNGSWNEQDGLLVVDLIRSAVETSVIRMSASELCSRSRSSDETREFIALARKVLGKLYPVPFPDDSCDAATTALRQAYASARRCSQDNDCVYVDESFMEVPASDFRFLSTGDCSGARPLVVGNAQRVAADRGALKEGRERAVIACKKRSAEASCTGFAEFVPTRPAPVCRGGACRPNPSTDIF